MHPFAPSSLPALTHPCRCCPMSLCAAVSAVIQAAAGTANSCSPALTGRAQTRPAALGATACLAASTPAAASQAVSPSACAVAAAWTGDRRCTRRGRLPAGRGAAVRGLACGQRAAGAPAGRVPAAARASSMGGNWCDNARRWARRRGDGASQLAVLDEAISAARTAPVITYCKPRSAATRHPSQAGGTAASAAATGAFRFCLALNIP